MNLAKSKKSCFLLKDLPIPHSESSVTYTNEINVRTPAKVYSLWWENSHSLEKIQIESVVKMSAAIRQLMEIN